ncbi:MAG: hypothetical protein HZA69_01755 [Gammaproteobacteria bacterium]|nr:hypothetical protein [Gammaproteobacteria bacterium]
MKSGKTPSQTASMTAFARHETGTPWGALTWELRSVNHRYLDIALRLPEELRSLEPRARADQRATCPRQGGRHPALPAERSGGGRDRDERGTGAAPAGGRRPTAPSCARYRAITHH